MTPEAPLEQTPSGLVPAGPGWFVVNVRDAVWATHPGFGSGCRFEAPQARFAELGINLRVLEPGQPSSLYHSEAAQEDFLVLAGECLLLVEGEERRLRAWDFLHCPPGTAHVLLGAGEGPCVLLATGARPPEPGLRYPVSEAARRLGAGVDRETTSAAEAYAPHGSPEPRRPPSWERLPWVRSTG